MIVEAYAVGAVGLLAVHAVRNPNTEVRTSILLCALWPITLLVVALLLVLGAINWDMQIAKGKTMFGCRRALNPNVRGFAVTVFGQEIRVWSKKTV